MYPIPTIFHAENVLKLFQVDKSCPLFVGTNLKTKNENDLFIMFLNIKPEDITNTFSFFTWILSSRFNHLFVRILTKTKLRTKLLLKFKFHMTFDLGIYKWFYCKITNWNWYRLIEEESVYS